VGRGRGVIADLVAVTNALAAQITAHTGLRAMGQARDQVTPPCAVVLPGRAGPFLQYGSTMDETFTLNLMVLILITDAAPVDASQRALDAYLGIDHGDGSGQSIPAAILKDTSLGGQVEWCEPVSADSYGRVEYSGIIYFGCRLNLNCGAI
jgi:hypothetical protein